MIYIRHIYFPMLVAGHRAIASAEAFVQNAIRGREDV
jgi:hypothetical protein